MSKKIISKIVNITLVFLMAGAMFASLPNAANAATTIYVPDDYATIQAAVDAASPGDTIIVRDDTYTKNIDVNRDHFTIQPGDSTEATIVYGANSNDHVFKPSADCVPTILILVNENIYSQIQGNLTVFEQDLNNEGSQAIITTVSDQHSPPDIRNIIKSHYAGNNLKGAILVGNIKAPYCEYHTGDFSDPEALVIWISLDATDMYYMDLDGQWEHVDNPSIPGDIPSNVAELHLYPSCETFIDEYIVYLGNYENRWDYWAIENKEQYKAEIWVSRIMAHNLDIPDFGGQAALDTGTEGSAQLTTSSPLQSSPGTPPDLTVFSPEIDGLTVNVNGVVFPGTPGTTITRINWDWGDGNSEDHWFPASHTYAAYGEYTITVTAYQSDGLSSTDTKQISLSTLKSEAQIINEFFDWDHEYRTGNYTISDKAYLCDAINDPIIDHGMDYTKIFTNIIKEALISKNKYVIYLGDPEGSKLIYILAHSWPQGHSLYDENLTVDELLQLKKNSTFYILNACSSCRWDQYVSFPDSPNYLGGLYVFTKTHSDGDYGLGAIGFTGVGGFNLLSYFTDYLNNNPNATYGEAYRYYFNNNLMHIFGPCNFVYLGDPTIGPQLVNQLPTASFTYSPQHPMVDEVITFDASSSFDPDGEIVSYAWDFGDGSTSSGKVVTYAYTSAGDYTVTLIVTDNDGDLSTYSRVVVVGQLPGDANGDGVVNNLDITKVERIIVGLDAETPGADANQDGVVNNLDITKVERIIVGLD